MLDLDNSGRLTPTGERMIFSEDATGTVMVQYDDVGTGRTCGSCTLCCKLLPVPPLHKAAGQRCTHQRQAKGCAIYATRPFDCRAWSCRWLADPTLRGLPRPDRCHYVIDISYDIITLVAPDGARSSRPRSVTMPHGMSGPHDRPKETDNMTMNDRPIDDPKLQKALNAIKATMANYGFAGACMLISPDEAAFFYVLHAPWSAIRPDSTTPLGWRFRAKSDEDGKAVAQARVEGAMHTICQLSDFGEQTTAWMEDIKLMLRRAGIDFEHTPFNGKPLPHLKDGGA